MKRDRKDEKIIIIIINYKLQIGAGLLFSTYLNELANAPDTGRENLSHTKESHFR